MKLLLSERCVQASGSVAEESYRQNLSALEDTISRRGC